MAFHPSSFVYEIPVNFRMESAKNLHPSYGILELAPVILRMNCFMRFYNGSEDEENRGSDAGFGGEKR